MVVITTPFKSENEFLKDLNRCWLLHRAMDPNGRDGEEYYSYHWGSLFCSVYSVVHSTLALASYMSPCSCLLPQYGAALNIITRQKAARIQKTETPLSLLCSLPSWAPLSFLVQGKSFLPRVRTGCCSGVEDA